MNTMSEKKSLIHDLLTKLYSINLIKEFNYKLYIRLKLSKH